MPFKTDAQRKRVMGYEIGRRASSTRISTSPKKLEDDEEESDEEDLEE